VKNTTRLDENTVKFAVSCIFKTRYTLHCETFDKYKNVYLPRDLMSTWKICSWARSWKSNHPVKKVTKQKHVCRARQKWRELFHIWPPHVCFQVFCITHCLHGRLVHPMKTKIKYCLISCFQLVLGAHPSEIQDYCWKFASLRLSELASVGSIWFCKDVCCT
jgi:hypothetical protein